jgi:hypothetical protein
VFRERFRRKIEAQGIQSRGPARKRGRIARRVLITSWSLATGRILHGVPPQSLTEDELISFWADDHIPAPRTGSG